MMNGQCLASETPTDIVNPFVHHLELTSTYEKIKAGILTVVILPARLVIIFSLLVMAWLLACIGMWGLTEEDLQAHPLSPWRRKVRDLVAKLGYWTYYAGGMRYLVRGTQAPRHEAPVLVIAPHSTFFDAGICYVTGFPSIIVRRESGLHPFMGKLINFTQPVYVWRDDPDSRQKTIKQIVARATSGQEWSQLLIFPEGTCTNRSCLITFKPGAFYPGVPVQPVLLRYPNKLDTVTWTWQGPGALKLMWLTLVQPQSNCEIEFLPVYKPSAAEKADPKLYAENVRRLMARALGVPTMDVTYDDCQAVTRANALHIPTACLAMKVYKRRIRLGLSWSKKEEKIVNAYPEQMYHEHLIDLPSFADRLGVSITDPNMKEIFSLLSTEDTGQIDLSEYLLCALLIERAHKQRELLQLPFTLCTEPGPYEALPPEQLAKVMRLLLCVNKGQAMSLASSLPTDDQGLVTLPDFEAFMRARPELQDHKKKD